LGKVAQPEARGSGTDPVLGVHGVVEGRVEVADPLADTPPPEGRLLQDVIAEVVPQEVVRSHDPVVVWSREPFPLAGPRRVDHVAVAIHDIGHRVALENVDDTLKGPGEVEVVRVDVPEDLTRRLAKPGVDGGALTIVRLADPGHDDTTTAYGPPSLRHEVGVAPDDRHGLVRRAPVHHEVFDFEVALLR
jgi:hypothetical protein